jgi:hypothetical protein
MRSRVRGAGKGYFGSGGRIYGGGLRNAMRVNNGRYAGKGTGSAVYMPSNTAVRTSPMSGGGGSAPARSALPTSTPNTPGDGGGGDGGGNTPGAAAGPFRIPRERESKARARAEIRGSRALATRRALKIGSSGSGAVNTGRKSGGRTGVQV